MNEKTYNPQENKTKGRSLSTLIDIWGGIAFVAAMAAKSLG